MLIARIGGRPVNQIFGTAIGTLIASTIVFLILRPAITLNSALLAAVAGMFWIIGQLGQYTGYRNIGVSKTMPISTGLQLIGTSLIGVLMFGEWPETMAKIGGALGIVLLIVGVILTSIQDHAEAGRPQNSLGTIVMLVFTTLGYLVYNTIPRALDDSGLAIFLPESLGMILAVLVYLVVTRQGSVLKERTSWQNVLGGLVFSVAAVTYILAVHDNGVNAAFVVSQLSVVISTLGGMIFLHETKTRREMAYTSIGLILIVVGAIVTTVI